MKSDKYLTSLFEITVNPKIDMLLEVWNLSFSAWNSHRWVRHFFSMNKTTAHLPDRQKSGTALLEGFSLWSTLLRWDTFNQFRSTFWHNAESLLVIWRQSFKIHRSRDKRYIFIDQLHVTPKGICGTLVKEKKIPEMRPFLLTVMVTVHKRASQKTAMLASAALHKKINYECNF